MNAAAASAARRRATAASVAALALFLALQAALWFAYYGDGAKRLIGDEASYQQIALAILGGGPWMPSTIWPPLQSLWLAALYALLGVHIAAAQVVQTVLFVGCGALLRTIWRSLSGSVREANVAAALFLFNPANAAYAQWLWPEVPHLFLVLLVFALLLRRADSRIAAAAAGACAGLALLAKSLLAAFWPLFLIVFFRRATPRLLLIPAAVFVLGIALVTAPALLHGWRAFGRPMIADSSMYNAWIGLTDRWRVDYVDDQGSATLADFLAAGATPEERNAVYLRKVEDFVAGKGIASVFATQLGRQYFRLFSAKTPLVSQLPGPACAGHLSVYRTSPALASTLTLVNDFFHALTLVGCAFGIACWRKRLNPGVLLIALYIAYQLALFAVLHVKARFLFPMMPFLCALAATFYCAAQARIARRDDDESNAMAFTVPRLAIGTVLAALALTLAFAGPALDHLCAG